MNRKHNKETLFSFSAQYAAVFGDYLPYSFVFAVFRLFSKNKGLPHKAVADTYPAPICVGSDHIRPDREVGHW